MFQKFGLEFDPFIHLDASKDTRLYDYLVIPKAVEIAWKDEPIALLSGPGGGKSALRAYTEKVYRDTRGAKLPITYIPETYSNDPDFHFNGLKRALARAIFIYLVSYPDIFLKFSSTKKSETKSILAFLPYEVDYLLSILESGEFIKEMEETIGVHAISGIQKIGETHQVLADQVRQTTPASSNNPNVDELFNKIREVFEVSSFHILIDGVDGFAESTPPSTLLTWLLPLIEKAEKWGQAMIFLKFFLPISLAEFPRTAEQSGISLATLTWDDSLLAQVIRRRLYVASQGTFDSLDAISAPDLRNVDLLLARQIHPGNKLPRQIIMRTRQLLERVQNRPDWLIQAEDIH